jgi:hypothetical protein
MDVGMLWFDGDREKQLEKRIGQAALYYLKKYGRRPNLCLMHPLTMRDEKLEQTEGLQVRMSTAVLPDHFWLGVEAQAEGEEHRLRAAA